MDKKATIQEFVDFVEGRMSFEEFWRNYETNLDYYRLLDDKRPNENFPYYKNDTICKCFTFYKNPLSSLGKSGIHHYVVRYLQYYNIPHIPTTKYRDDHRFRLDIQPSYVSIEDEEFLKPIIASTPEGLSSAQKKKWLKEKIKILFRYDKSPPRWVQWPEWPIVNGKPLVFKSQTKTTLADERVWYTFYDLDTKEEIVIEQFY